MGTSLALPPVVHVYRGTCVPWYMCTVVHVYRGTCVHLEFFDTLKMLNMNNVILENYVNYEVIYELV